MLEYKQVLVVKSELAQTTVEVPPWEVPVLAAVNGDDACTVVGSVKTKREIPDAAAEYARLETRYKAPADGPPFVAIVYGVGQLGVQRLAAEIAKTGEYADPLQTPLLDDFGDMEASPLD